MSYLQYLKLLSNDLHLTLNLNIYCNFPIIQTEEIKNKHCQSLLCFKSLIKKKYLQTNTLTLNNSSTSSLSISPTFLVFHFKKVCQSLNFTNQKYSGCCMKSCSRDLCSHMDSTLQDIPNHILCVPKERATWLRGPIQKQEEDSREHFPSSVTPGICLTGCIQRHKNPISFLLSAMSGGQAEGRGKAQTPPCCSRTALAEDCTEKDPEVWEDTGLHRVVSWQLSPVVQTWRESLY